MKILFLDESGDHNLSKIDPQYPMFVLGGVVLEEEYAKKTLRRELDQFKRDLFRNTDIVLHTADITRNKNGFECLKDSTFRSRFYECLNVLMRGLDYTVIACAIHKEEHLSRYDIAAVDPYLLSLNVIVERFCYDLKKENETGLIVAEKRDPILDRELEISWLDLKIKGTRFLRASEIDKRIQSLNLRPKSDNIPGLQLADLVVSPVGRHLLGKKDKEDWKIIESKLRQSSKGRTEGFGLVSLPKKKGSAPATQ